MFEHTKKIQPSTLNISRKKYNYQTIKIKIALLPKSEKDQNGKKISNFFGNF